jgi:hypothetical protein
MIQLKLKVDKASTEISVLGGGECSASEIAVFLMELELTKRKIIELVEEKRKPVGTEMKV